MMHLQWLHWLFVGVLSWALLALSALGCLTRRRRRRQKKNMKRKMTKLDFHRFQVRHSPEFRYLKQVESMQVSWQRAF